MRLNFNSYGRGPALIILHGLFGSLDNWHSIAKIWAEQFQVFTLDLRNHGRSPHDQIFSYQVMAADLSEFIAEQGLTAPALLGHSMGGKVAMEFALTNPDKLTKLIVVDIAPKAYPPHHEMIFQALRSIDLTADSSRNQIDARLAEQIPDFATRQFLMKNLHRGENGKFEWKMNLPVIYQNYQQINQAISATEPFDHPTLFVRGGRSNYLIESDLTMIKSLFPQAELITIANAGHWVHAEAPQQLVKVVSDFLA